MAKTRAEIQRDYRERKKKKEGEEYLEKERKRRMKYVKSELLSRRERSKRNEKNRENVRRCRQRKKETLQREALANENISDANTSGYETGEPLVVQMNFAVPGRREGPRKRNSKALSKAYREIKNLKAKNLTIERKYRSTKKMAERYRKRISKSKKTEEEPRTPRSKTEAVIKAADLTTSQASVIRKQILFSNVLTDELNDSKSAAKNNRMKKKSLRSIINGKVIKKYRCVSSLSRKIGFSRSSLHGTQHKWIGDTKEKRKRVQETYRDTVMAFLTRDDNSRVQPEKADSKKSSDGKKIQTRVLTDYLKNLHSKFLSENTHITMSFATFCRMRPKHIQITSFISRSSCLCTKHQNIALILKALRREGVNISQNPESFIKTDLSEDEIMSKLPEKVVFGQWQRVKIEEKNKVKNIMKIVENSLEKADFMNRLRKQTEEFKGHVLRVKTQYDQIKVLKENLPSHHIIVHMDFSENYNCKNVAEIQSAYWNKQNVTLHPTVVYHKDFKNELQHQSLVFVSDELAHCTSTVIAILNKLIPYIKQMDPELEMIHYWTDGPTSQYRNKDIFNTVANHAQIYGVPAKWNYFESGHGKGPCDGLGGTVKRMADEAVNSEKAAIQDANDFYKWASQSSMKSVKFVFVSSEECQKVAEELKSKTLKPVKGTFCLHAVAGLGHSRLAVRNVSCYCDVCLNGNLCDSWKVEEMTETKRNKKTSETEAVLDNPTVTENMVPVSDTPDVENTGSNNQLTYYSPGEFVAAVYIDNNEPDWYIGEVLQVDEKDCQHEISFLQQKKHFYQWPQPSDEIWRYPCDILCGIEKPKPTGKSGRMLKLSEADQELAEEAFKVWKLKQSKR